MGQGRAFPAYWEFHLSHVCPIRLLSDIPPILEHGTPRFRGHVAIVTSTWQDRSDPSAAAARAEVSEPLASAVPDWLDLTPVAQEADPHLSGDITRAQANISHPAPEKKKAMPMKPAESEENPCSAVYRRPYRDRVIHLLALRTYKKPELLARLQRDGVMQKDKGTLGKILQQVANLNLKDNSFSLKEHLFQTLQTDWPGYTDMDRENLKLILARKSAPFQNPTSTSQAPSPGPSETDAPARLAQKRPLASDFTSPVMSKKRQIGHQQFTSHVQPAAGGLSSSWVLPSSALFTQNVSPRVGSISSCPPEVHHSDKFQSSGIPEPARVQMEMSNSTGQKNELGRLKQSHPLDFDEASPSSPLVLLVVGVPKCLWRYHLYTAQDLSTRRSFWPIDPSLSQSATNKDMGVQQLMLNATGFTQGS
ncbi:PREDICTED: RNA polymerase II elongation factor ELL2 [Ficedula albicollis]|uniref:RNA polymerase II elongation factor ELL2 n=1 Tax=Ficedula albicollis TaxID=59894 RepID=UPI0007AD8B5A|nr:PREDICTED: RNA polymerase II elongation factor ELL2 [Ficedula albicollis]